MQLMRPVGLSATQVSAEAVRGLLPENTEARLAVGRAGGFPPWARWAPSSALSNVLLPATRVSDQVTVVEPHVTCIAHRQAWPLLACPREGGFVPLFSSTGCATYGFVQNFIFDRARGPESPRSFAQWQPLPFHRLHSPPGPHRLAVLCFHRAGLPDNDAALGMPVGTTCRGCAIH